MRIIIFTLIYCHFATITELVEAVWGSNLRLSKEVIPKDVPCKDELIFTDHLHRNLQIKVILPDDDALNNRNSSSIEDISYYYADSADPTYSFDFDDLEPRTIIVTDDEILLMGHRESLFTTEILMWCFGSFGITMCMCYTNRKKLFSLHNYVKLWSKPNRRVNDSLNLQFSTHSTVGTVFQAIFILITLTYFILFITFSLVLWILLVHILLIVYFL